MKPVVIEVGPGHTAWAEAPRLLTALDVLGIKRVREKGCWAFPAARVPDVVAYYEHRHRPVEVNVIDR